ncbi:protein kinase family protein [Archangium violaceum]|uniref:hypothetical protein n=1 Tax=Archangium violaceum TaxID=83451 RepID=UPI002B27D841|nr:protein kinase family protein [Archangium violaceum]
MSTPSFDPVSLKPSDEVAGWRVLSRWRQDAFSITWAVERAGVRRLLRIALLPRGSAEAQHLEEYLEREAGALRLVRHPCIIRLHAEGRWPDPVHGFRYLLLDYAENTTLKDAKRRGMNPKQTVAMFSKLAQVIGAMRRVRLNHGSIQTDNILVRPNGQPLLIDFSRSDWPGNPYPPLIQTATGFGRLEDLFQDSTPGSSIPSKRYSS